MPEIAGQIHTGRPLSERECFQHLLFHINGVKTALHGLAVLRMDTRWVMCVRIMDKVEDSVKRLIDKGGPRVIWMPDRDQA